MLKQTTILLQLGNIDWIQAFNLQKCKPSFPVDKRHPICQLSIHSQRYPSVFL